MTGVRLAAHTTIAASDEHRITTIRSFGERIGDGQGLVPYRSQNPDNAIQALRQSRRSAHSVLLRPCATNFRSLPAGRWISRQWERFKPFGKSLTNGPVHSYSESNPPGPAQQVQWSRTTVESSLLLQGEFEMQYCNQRPSEESDHDLLQRVTRFLDERG